MTANVSTFHQNYNQDKKNPDAVEKDIRKWVESVVEFKANLDKQKSEPPLEKHLKRVKKYKIKKKPSLVAVQVVGGRNATGQRKNLKSKKVVKKPAVPNAEKSRKQTLSQPADLFDEIKESYRNVKLPPNWTSGMSNGKIVFNRIKVTTMQNSQQKMAVERSLVVTKDRNLHVLINGSEIILNNWELQKVESVDDIKRAIKDIDALKVCDGPANGPKSPQCSMLVESKLKTCQACKTETGNPQKVMGKKPPKKRSNAGKAGAQQQKPTPK